MQPDNPCLPKLRWKQGSSFNLVHIVYRSSVKNLPTLAGIKLNLHLSQYTWHCLQVPLVLIIPFLSNL
uniref:Uncharacterized protein n=1 Tax=Picea glauca TaxID=3330 RepID=A0A101M1F4_PICGL|nr:hypothetical protein ABT39_MTgene3825 [Picea glauca]QHR90812.1 hypothetical protein Q903MT_gene4838 [Picea sitchensis]